MKGVSWGGDRAVKGVSCGGGKGSKRGIMEGKGPAKGGKHC